MSKLVVMRNIGQGLIFYFKDVRLKINFSERRGNLVKFFVEAPEDVRIVRTEEEYD